MAAYLGSKGNNNGGTGGGGGGGGGGGCKGDDNNQTEESSSQAIRSKFVGVSWAKMHKKWHCQIMMNGKNTNLGYFNDEKDAACKYDEQASLLKKPVNFPQHEGQEQAVKQAPMRDRSKVPNATSRSKFVGVTWNKKDKKWQVRIRNDGRTRCLGSFNDEKEAACKYDEQAVLLRKPVNFPHHEGQKQAVKVVPKESSPLPMSTSAPAIDNCDFPELSTTTRRVVFATKNKKNNKRLKVTPNV